MLIKILVVIIVIALSACSSIKSIECPTEGDLGDGLTYYMPKKDILVTMVIAKDKGAEVTLGTTPSYPDLSKQYVLRHGGNLFGKNVLDVSVNDAGLLASSKSTTTSNVGDVFRNLAALAGSITGMEAAEVTCAEGTHTFVIKLPATTQTLCGFMVTIEEQANPVHVVSHSKTEKKWHSGIFYRQNMPYLVSLKSATGSATSRTVQSIVFSPSQSKTHFLPISQTFFSNNAADFTFTDGMPTKYNQDTDGEVVALLKIPADIISAYFGAIGSVFNNFKTQKENEAASLTESLKLELAKKKYDACISAINAGETDKIKELGCGQ